MFEKPDVGRIERLHHIGRQLAVLKRMYESYAMIINHILDSQKPFSSLSASDMQPSTDPSFRQTIGVPLSSGAIMRFKRLKDRVNLLALSEIQDCLEAKEALVFLVCFKELFEFTTKTLNRTSILSPLNNPKLWSASPALLFCWRR